MHFIDKFVHSGHFYPRMTLVRLQFAAAAFEGTVLEGELVQLLPPKRGDGRWVFLVNDLCAYAGTSASAWPLKCRRALVHLMLDPSAHHPDAATDVCAVRAKRYLPTGALRDVVVRQLLAGTLDYEVTAVVFRSLESTGADIVLTLPRRAHEEGEGASATPTATAQQGEDVQEDDGQVAHERGGEERTAVFFTRRTDLPDVYELYATRDEAVVGSPGALLAGVPSMHASTVLRSNTAAGNPTTFVFSQRFQKWVPMGAANSTVV